jgi:hypothetical protein
MRVPVVGGPAAGKIEHAYGAEHKRRWRIAMHPKMLAAMPSVGDPVPESVPLEVADYEFHLFRLGARDLFVLAPVGWDGFDIMGELLASYQQAHDA